MATEPKTNGLTYADLQRIPKDNLRREIIDGDLFVTPAPGGRHQDAVLEIASRLLAYAKRYGGKAYVTPRDVLLSQDTVLEPDVLFIRTENMDRVEERYVRGAPDIVVEVSSPSTRRTDQGRKREVYERYGVPEYWFVDLDAGRVEVYRLAAGRYGDPELLDRGETLESPIVPGLSIPVDDLLGAP